MIVSHFQILKSGFSSYLSIESYLMTKYFIKVRSNGSEDTTAEVTNWNSSHMTLNDVALGRKSWWPWKSLYPSVNLERKSYAKNMQKNLTLIYCLSEMIYSFWFPVASLRFCNTMQQFRPKTVKVTIRAILSRLSEKYSFHSLN